MVLQVVVVVVVPTVLACGVTDRLLLFPQPFELWHSPACACLILISYTMHEQTFVNNGLDLIRYGITELTRRTFDADLRAKPAHRLSKFWNFALI